MPDERNDRTGQMRATEEDGRVLPRAAEPEDLNRLFAERANDGDVEELVALYEADATLAFPPGQVVSGTAAIRRVFTQVLAGKPTLTAAIRPAIHTGDLALTSVQWTMRMAGPDGAPMTLSGISAEVVRRQSDGAWLRVIDQPNILASPNVSDG
ncbi:MAG: YybH family protein [Thermomicrobiales bacterium]